MELIPEVPFNFFPGTIILNARVGSRVRLVGQELPSPSSQKKSSTTAKKKYYIHLIGFCGFPFDLTLVGIGRSALNFEWSLIIICSFIKMKNIHGPMVNIAINFSFYSRAVSKRCDN